MDRMLSPESALEQAKLALRNEDLLSYFDALTLPAVHSQLKNSISICENYELMKGTGLDVTKSVGCETLLKKYGWVTPKTGAVGDEITTLWDDAVRKIDMPRELAAKLEANHRKYGAGTTFVLTYLDSVQIIKVTKNGETAKAIVDWNGESRDISFELDESGWRVNPHPEE